MQSGWAIGCMLTALLAAAVMPRWGWRPLFVAEVVPALLAVWVLARVDEPRRAPSSARPFALSPALWRRPAIAS